VRHAGIAARRLQRLLDDLGNLEESEPPGQNASTAISLAAFSTTGQAPPCLNAS